MNRSLNKSEILSYQNNGYVHCKNIMSKKTLEKLYKSLLRVEEYPETLNKWMKYFDPKYDSSSMVLTRVENFIHYNEFLKKFFKSKKLQNNLKLLYGKKVLLFKDKYHPKLPGSKGFEAHQDATIWEGMYKMKNYITMCIMLEDSTKNNGPLEFAKYDVKKKNLLSKSWSLIPKNKEKKLKWKKIFAKQGDIFFFDDYIPHRSSNNFSKTKSRRSLFITYNDSKYGSKRKKYYEDKRKSYPPNFERKEGKNYIFKA